MPRALRSFLILLLSFVLDRATKMFALQLLSAAPLPVCYGVNLVLSWNRGVTWSMFSTVGSSGLLILYGVQALMIVAFAAYAFLRARQNKNIMWELLVLGGAISNMVDRIMWGAVLDFIELYVAQFSWPIFNVADAFIVIGIGGIFIRTWRSPNE